MPEYSGTICLAVYKPDLLLLRRQILSIRQQSITSWNCIIGIDGADKLTAASAMQLVEGDPRFRVVEFPERLGFYRNFERLLGLVGGDVDWVALADQDDFWYPDKLKVLLDSLPASSMVLGQAQIVCDGGAGEDRKILGTTNRSFFSLGELILDNVVSGALCVFRRDLLSIALPFPPPTDVAYHDHWLGLCAALQNGIASTQHVVQDYVQHGRNVIGEEMATGATRRYSALLGRAPGVWSVGRYIVNHRWRWRVSMARLALARFEHLPARSSRDLRLFAADRPTWGLTFLILASFVRGNCSKLRIISIWTASFAAPFIREEASVEA